MAHLSADGFQKAELNKMGIKQARSIQKLIHIIIHLQSKLIEFQPFPRAFHI